MTATATSPSTGRASSVPVPIPASRLPVGKLLGAFLLVLCLVLAVAAVWVSASQAPVPTNMPFGVTGASPVVQVAQSKKLDGYQMSFVNTTYPSESAAMAAIDQGKIYAAYITGAKSDKLLISEAKSFFAYTEIRPLFAAVAKVLHRPLTIAVVKPLPAGKDPVGAVAGLLLMATTIGGFVAGIFIFALTHAAVQRWRGLILVAITLLGALLTDLIAGPGFGAYASDRFWPLLPCLWVVTLATALVGAALIAILPAVVAIVVSEVLFIVLGVVTAGSSGVALLPSYWQTIGGLLPPRSGVDLYRNVLYFSSNNIGTPVAVLLGYGLVATAVLAYAEWFRPRGAAVPARNAGPAGRAARSLLVKALISVVVVVAVYQSAFTAAYVSADHNPVSSAMPFATVGDSPLPGAVEKTGEIAVTSYHSRSAAKAAIAQGKAYGALFAHAPADRLLTVPSKSALAPWTLPVAFEQAAATHGQKLLPTSYTPTPLASGDPFGLVLAVLLTPLLLFGYQVVSFVKMATRVTAGPLLGLSLIGFAIVATLAIDLIAWALHGIPGDKFWVLWGVMALTMAGVAMIAAVMQRLLGAIGTLLTVFVIILLGKPSSGGANGVPYLPGFWSAIGPYLPPRNALILMRNTVYFGGNGITQALIILLAYFAVFGVILAILDWKHRVTPEVQGVTPETEAMTTAVAIPVGAPA